MKPSFIYHPYSVRFFYNSQQYSIFPEYLIEYTESHGLNHKSIESKVLEISQSCQLSSPYITLADFPLEPRTKRIQDMEAEIKKQYYYKEIPRLEEIQSMVSRRNMTATIDVLNLSMTRFQSEREKSKKNQLPDLFPLDLFTKKYRSIKKLYLSDMEIFDEKTLNPIEALYSLELLDISFNKLKHAPRVVSRCVNLKVLNASGNLIADIKEFSSLKGLSELDMRFNPCCEIGNYRERLGHAMSNLKILDGVRVVVLLTNNFLDKRTVFL
jgi:hypothetical protein